MALRVKYNILDQLHGRQICFVMRILSDENANLRQERKTMFKVDYLRVLCSGADTRGGGAGAPQEL